MLKMPNDAVPKAEFGLLRVLGEQRVQEEIQWYDLPMAIYMMSYLPADASTRPRNSDTLADNTLLELDVFINGKALLLLFADIVWR